MTTAKSYGHAVPIREVLQATAFLVEEVAFASGYEPEVGDFDAHCPARDYEPCATIQYDVESSADLYKVGDAVIWAAITPTDYRGITAWVDFIASTALITFPNFLSVRIVVAGKKEEACLDR